jgi:hypothetical protein
VFWGVVDFGELVGLVAVGEGAGSMYGIGIWDLKTTIKRGRPHNEFVTN